MRPKNFIITGTFVLLGTVTQAQQAPPAATSGGRRANSQKSFTDTTVVLKGATVTSKTHTRELKESGFAVNAIETKVYANTTADMNTVLNRTTGVKVREQGGVGSDFNFSINGLSGKAIRFFIDGIPMEVMGSSMTLNNIPVNLAERIEVYKGVLPVSLGADALGGAVNLVTNQQVKNYLDASYSFGSFNTHRAAITGQATHQKTGIITRLSAFYNYSDNNYKMKGIEIWDEKAGEYGDYVKKDFRRFHDLYRSAMVQGEIGVLHKKWADVFFVGAGYSATDKELQTGTNQENVYGAATRNGDAFNATLRYKKADLFTKGLELSVFASHTADKYQVTDTAGYRYFWDGTSVKTNQGELSSIKTLTHISRPRNFARVNLSYNINTVHSLNLNYTFDQVKNHNYNELLTDKDHNPGKIGKHILGLAYQQNLLEGRWTNTFFGKYYGMDLSQPQTLSGTGTVTTASDFQSYTGYGLATRFKITDELGVKASYEKAYRLQEVGEMFGNGYDQIANPKLRPENSNNFNVGAYYGLQKGPHRFFAEGGWYFRDAADFIYSVVYMSNAKVSRYENTSKVRVNGLEAELQYDYKDLLHVNVNGSYQNAINNTKYPVGSNSGTVEATYKNKIPNMPWLFGNAAVSIGKNNLLGKDTRLQLNWDMQYVHWFYLTWESYGSKYSNNKIPDQYIQNVSLTYSLQNGKYNISAECKNFADALAYDNFGLQKPGRSLFVKFRYFLK
ncbi:TonB-dependent receptor domain-containing protein [Chitinophaga arvensicola]|uniref:Outer membrane cobalamin receptor protein n=1 Tax=Chitinophaga arvensicola TaxID=29529 RepID=A0A1I0RRB6_9BACT|nr:TonB-dependent receptor [Chitinophaga arvensicola]SEW43312.1 Outer membrane cobalamin receptor protein [Chitinophaga arvensicola]